MRINKYIAKSGLCSRRKAEEYILDGRIKVNGKVIKDLSFRVQKGSRVVFDENILSIDNEKPVYLILNKPEGFITTVKDQFDRKSVMDLLTDIQERIYPVGRLDYETSGLLILTNDGDLTFKLTHPKHEIDKIYIASVKGIPSKNEVFDFENGLEIDNYITSKANLKILKRDTKKNYSVLRVVIHEGHNRQVRNMLEKINHPVMNLKRIGIGKIDLSNLEVGRYRFLSEEEIDYLKSL